MKRIVLTMIIAVAIIISAMGQEKEDKLKALEQLELKNAEVLNQDTLILDDDTLIAEEENFAIPDRKTHEGDTTRVKIGDVVTVEDTDDETLIRIGHRGIRIKDNGKESEINFEDFRKETYAEYPGRAFRGHLGGIEFGFNNYSTGKWGSSPEPVEQYFDLNSSKSTSFNLCLFPVSLGFTRHFGLVTTIGIGWNNYFFDAGNSIMVDEDGLLQPVFPSAGEVKKSKLSTTYAFLPVMFEVQLPVTYNKTINIGAGMIGAIKLGSHTKVVYSTEGVHREKVKDDFNLNLLRYGATARVGYEMFQVYGTCYLSPLFEKGKGPELYPFEVGIALTLNN
jgi:hypothetical protein